MHGETMKFIFLLSVLILSSSLACVSIMMVSHEFPKSCAFVCPKCLLDVGCTVMACASTIVGNLTSAPLTNAWAYGVWKQPAGGTLQFGPRDEEDDKQ
jgi:hypothetical protein